MRNMEEEARNIWDIGKLLGVSFTGNDREITQKLVEMETRDKEATQGHLNKEEEVNQECVP